MTNFIPIFPLGIVVYPGEDLNLHVFEPRYKQMINECHKEKKPFGIPAVIDNHMQEVGTLVQIVEIVNTTTSGEIDIRTKGVKVFRILEVIKEVPDKLFSGAIVNYPANNEKGFPQLMKKLMEGIHELHKLLKVEKDFHIPEADLNAYNVAHHIGLTLQEEYELLGLMNEKQRQEFIKRHLTKVIPMVTEMEGLKEKIKLNGHFKNLHGFDLNL